MTNKKNREMWVDYTKTFACLLVVIGHLLQGIKMANIEWNADLYYYINKYIYIFHMPLFMCLSGYLYGKNTKITSVNEYLQFVKKKFINLSIPYFVFYIVHVSINMIFSNSVNSQMGIQDILAIFTNPIPPFWFLYALLCIFIAIPIIEYIFKKNHIATLIILTMMHIVNIFYKTNIYAIDVFAEFGVYFYLGIFILKSEISNCKQAKLLAHIAIFTLASLLYCYILKNNIININLINIFKFTLAIYGTLISIMVFKITVNKLTNIKSYNEISKYTFQIYLMHTIFSAGMRICLVTLNINNFYIHIILGILAGIIGPIVIAKILEKTKYGNLLIYPLNTIKNIKSIKNKTII